MYVRTGKSAKGYSLLRFDINTFIDICFYFVTMKMCPFFGIGYFLVQFFASIPYKKHIPRYRFLLCHYEHVLILCTYVNASIENIYMLVSS